MDRRLLDLTHVTTVVLDEADEMLDLGVLWSIPYFLTVFLQWPEEWHDPPPTTLLNAFYPFLVAGGIALGVFITPGVCSRSSARRPIPP